LAGGIRAVLFGGTRKKQQAVKQIKEAVLLLVFIKTAPTLGANAFAFTLRFGLLRNTPKACEDSPSFFRQNAFAFHLTIQIERARPKRARSRKFDVKAICEGNLKVSVL
jgi:hypothetical protein